MIQTVKGEEVRGDQERRKKESEKVQERGMLFMCQEVDIARI